MKGYKMSSRRIRRLLKKVTIDDANIYSLSIGQVEARLKSSFKAYKEAKKEASMWRDDFLVDLAKAKAKANDTEPEAELQAMRRIDTQKRMARNVKHMRGKLTIQVYVTPNNIRRVAVEKQDIENVCIAENDSRFSQLETTPPMSEPLLSALGYLANGPAIEDILNGTYIPPDGTNYYVALLLRELKIPDAIQQLPPVKSTVTFADQRHAWKIQKETTAAEPTGLSFSHYKAAATDNILCEFDAILRSLPYQFGFPPQLWQNILDVEILKKAIVFDIEKMRTITLMNAEFNMNNKQLGRDMMRTAEKAGTIMIEQSGSRKHHRAILAALNKQLTMDLLCQQRRAGGLGATDLKSCYDRAVHSIANLSMRRQGVTKSCLDSAFVTLQHASHKIRTVLGISASSFGSDRSPPLQGLGQGNGLAPSAWAAISTPLIAMVKRAGYGLQLYTAISSTLIWFLCFSFVDDTDLVHTANDVSMPGKDLPPEMQDFVDHWEGGRKATGGAIRPDKSYLYLIDFIWTGSRWRYRQQVEMPENITVKNGHGEPEVLTRLDPDDARKTLGVYLAMDGNSKAQVSYLRDKATDFAECIRTGFVTRAKSWYALKSTIMKTLEYPMEAISLTKLQRDYVMAPILTSTLPKAGFVRTYKRDVIYAPP
jgi:hypothetical protein